ncbi:ATP-binding cassette domain-containing protein [Alkalibaculum sp. M08DMB]|uniref:ATP-binding cassette domain-containing protein n=1 Tax=Alkalibaculum sporogenes TaxID=2655001 RepID=A0A6A7KB81_9FIRM|nr:ATP-binding cassette domain-containing protein [Alkalibaculum sporogenes]MPW26664.1 ATP-binding cassette domain-containing protein [Alkalibaculum sporogenes]
MNLKLENLKKIYDHKTVVDIDKFEFKSGKVYAILGPNGAGKTTMLRMLAGVEKGDEGSILYNDHISINYKKVSYMPQQTYLFNTTVKKNVGLGIENSKESKEKIYSALRYVGMDKLSNKKAIELSGGESQRVAIARLLVRHRELVLMDEPSSATDLSANELLVDYIKRVNKNGQTTIILITHNPIIAVKVADESIFMMNGKIIESGKSSEIIYLPKTQEMKSFLENWRM